MRRLDHPHDRLRERTLIAPKELDALIERVKGMQLTAGKTYHYEWPDRGYAVIAPTRKGSDMHVVKTVLAPRMKPPGEKVAGMYSSFFRELEKIATILFAATGPTHGLRVAAPPQAPPPTSSFSNVATPPKTAPFGGRATGTTSNKQFQTFKSAYPAPSSHTLSLSQVPGEVQRRYGARAPQFASSMAAQAAGAAQEMQAAGGDPTKSIVSIRPNAPNAYGGGRMSMDGTAPLTLGHEAGHAVDHIVHADNPKFFGDRNIFRTTNAIPSEVSATRRALSYGRPSPEGVARMLAATSSYIENEVPELQKSLSSLRARVADNSPEAARARAADNSNYYKAQEKYRIPINASDAELSPQQKLMKNLTESRKTREEFRNPFVSPASPEIREATKKHVDLVAKELEKHFSPEDVATYRQQLVRRIDHPSRATFRDFSEAAGPAAKRIKPAAATAVAAAEKGLPSWGSSLRNAFSRLVKRV